MVGVEQGGRIMAARSREPGALQQGAGSQEHCSKEQEAETREQGDVSRQQAAGCMENRPVIGQTIAFGGMQRELFWLGAVSGEQRAKSRKHGVRERQAASVVSEHVARNCEKVCFVNASGDLRAKSLRYRAGPYL